MAHTWTRVWEIDGQLVAADTVEEAIALMREYMGVGDYRSYEPRNISGIHSSGDNTSSGYSVLITDRK